MIDSGFACLITADKNLAFQQSIDERTVCVLVLPSPRFGDLEPIMDDIARAIASIGSGTVVTVSADGRFRLDDPKKT